MLEAKDLDQSTNVGIIVLGQDDAHMWRREGRPRWECGGGTAPTSPRLTTDGTVERAHQEDLCQATGREPTAKYERTGGPTLREAAELLDAHARDPLAELDRLVAHVTFAVIVGNANAQGKNTALLHHGADVELAPLYDQVPTVLWPNLRRDPAMSIGSRVTGINEVRADDIASEARHWAHDPERAHQVVTTLAQRALDVADLADHEQVAELVTANAARLLGG